MKILGKNPSGAHRKNVEGSAHFKDGTFKNLLETPMMSENATPYALFKDLLVAHPNRTPLSPLPSVKTRLYDHTHEKPVITWFGHSSYHISFGGKNVLVDPVFS